jgi:hypothetical protein
MIGLIDLSHEALAYGPSGPDEPKGWSRNLESFAVFNSNVSMPRPVALHATAERLFLFSMKLRQSQMKLLQATAPTSLLPSGAEDTFLAHTSGDFIHLRPSDCWSSEYELVVCVLWMVC